MRKLYYILMALAILTVACNAQAQKRQNKPAKVPAKKDTLAIIQEKVEAGDLDAMNTLGCWYYEGKNVKQDYKQAVSLFTKAADKGHAKAIGNMAMCFQTGNGLKKDSLMAVKLYEKSITEGNTELIKQLEESAKKGSAFCGILLYEIFHDGIGVDKDEKAALTNLKHASDANSTEAQVKYGLVCMNSKNFTPAAAVFSKLAKKNHPTGIYYTGYLLFKGMGVDQDKGKGLTYLTKAADLNMPNANYYVGKAYLDGDGVGKDAAKAVKYLEKAAVEPFIPDAKWLLGNCYLDGEGVKQDYANAAKWLAEVADHKDYSDRFQALMSEKRLENFRIYLNGLKDYYINKDYASAMTSFKLLQKVGCPEGLTMQAICLLNSNYDKHNDKKGLKLLEEAAKNSATAAFKLGEIYDQGILVDKNVKKAVDLIEGAAEKGHGEAVCVMGMKYFKGLGVPQDYVKAAKYLLRAEAMQSLTVEGAQSLATCYKNKISSLPDLYDAEERIKKLSNTKENDTLLTLLRSI